MAWYGYIVAFDGFNFAVGMMELNTLSLMMLNVDSESMNTLSLNLSMVTRCVGRPFWFEGLRI